MTAIALLMTASLGLATGTAPLEPPETADAASLPDAAPAAATEAAATEASRPALSAPVDWTLDDGTTVFLVEDHRVPLVELRVQVPTGYFHPWFMENGGQEAFTNQYQDSAGTLRARADALAADVAFGVKEQRAFVKLRCLKRDLPDAIKLLGDILSNTDYDVAQLERDQKSREIEWKSAMKDPESRSGIAILESLFADGDARRITATKPPEVVMDVEKLVATRDAMLRMPGRALGFGGDLTREEAAALADGLLPALVPELPEGVSPVLHPLQDRPPSLTETMPGLNQVYFSWYRDSVPWDAPGETALDVANHVLGGHFYSRLNVALRHEGGQTYGARASAETGTEPRPYIITTYTRADNKDATEATLREVLETFRAEGITQQELDDTIGYMRGRLLFGHQAPASVLDEALWEHGNDREPGHDAAQVAAAEALTLEEVNAFIASFYDPEAFTMLVVEPEG